MGVFGNTFGELGRGIINGITAQSDLAFYSRSRSGLSLVDDYGNHASILTPTLFINNSDSSLSGLASRSEEKLFDGNSYTIYFKFKLMTDVPASGFATGITMMNLGSGAGTQRGLSWYINNNAVVMNISDGTTRFTPTQCAGLNSLNKSIWYEVFLEIDFDTKFIRSKFYNGDTVVGSSINQTITALVFNSNNNVVPFSFGQINLAFCEFKKFQGLKTLAQCRDTSYTTNLQLYYPDLVSGTDVSGNNKYLTKTNITQLDYYYSDKVTYLLDNGYSRYVLAGSNDIHIPLDINGVAPSISLPSGYILQKTFTGNSSKHNLSDSYILFTQNSMDRSNTTIFEDEARLNYYDVARPKAIHINELNRLLLNDYYKTGYKGLLFPKITNNSYADRQILDELILYTSDKTGILLTSILNYTKDAGISSMLYLKSPYTQVFRATATSSSEFTLKINKGWQYSINDIISEIDTMPLLNSSEDFITKFFRYFTSVSGPWISLGPNYILESHPVAMNNSYDRPECSGLSTWALNILSNYYSKSTLNLYAMPGDFMCGTDTAMFWFVSRVMLYKDIYTPASLGEVQSDLKLFSEPLKKTANSAVSYSGVVPFSSYVETPATYSTDVSYTSKLPINCSVLFPVKSTNIPKKAGGANITDYANAIVTIPAGASGIVDMPLMLCRITGTGTIILDEITYTLPTDQAAILTKLELFEKFYHQVQVLTSTGSGITIEYLLNSRRSLLFNNNTVNMSVLSGGISLSRETTALIVPSFPLSVNTSDNFTINNYLYWTEPTSLKVPVTSLYTSANRLVTFYKKNGQTMRSEPIYGETNDVANTAKVITAGTRVIDKCFASRLDPRNDTFSASLELTLTTYDGSSCYYTLDGSTPDATKTLYTTPFTISSTTTVKWINIKTSYADSHVNSRTITMV